MRTTKVLLTVTFLLGLAASAHATVAGTKHDLSSANPNVTASSVHSSTQNQTCVFCHTPHNATTNKLLWNRNDSALATMSIYTSYNSTAMRNALIGYKVLQSGSTSLLCLSCHSLTSSDDVINNTANGKGGTPATYTPGTFSVGKSASTAGMNNLTNDHPVGIPYDTARAQDTTGLAAYSPGYVVNTKVRLFSSPTGANSMECATCHLVHDNTNGKFLAISNDQSALCTTCHNK